MLKLLLFLKRIYYVLLFIALEAIAIGVFLHSNLYQKARLAGASDRLVSGIYDKLADIGEYFSLRAENRRLLDEIARLRSLPQPVTPVLGHTAATDSIPVAELLQQYRYQPARVIRNSISKRENYITIDRGTVDGVEPEMALIADDGIVGYVVRCSDHFSVAVSILNTRDFRTSGRIQGSDFFGSIYWDGLNHREVILDEIPKYADMEVGDTVVTTNYSYIFPPDQPIGTVESFEMVNGTFYKVRVRLFTDLARLRRVYAVHYLEQEERRALESTVGNAETGISDQTAASVAGNGGNNFGISDGTEEGGRP
ncbi:rod shape-determining protein MreC [uncultured Rikenella sp.]|uniref:rod shape-determining protein MreC n=1 Tax=uncultured Rikenella sp. TaxID=368003 RepID=UPI00272C8928|nr:rod shape-determining protein MreC [uncultured Rikenella sp.]